MNKAEFITLIEHPENLEKVHINALKSISTDFPYLQQAQSLLAKTLFNEKHYEFEKQLRNAALMVPDREVLYAYIHDLKQAEIPKAITTLPEVNMPVEQPAAIEDLPPVEMMPELQPDPVEEEIAAVLAEDMTTENVTPSVEETTTEAEKLVSAAEALLKDATTEEEETEELSHKELSFVEWLQLGKGKLAAIPVNQQDNPEIKDDKTETEEISETRTSPETPAAPEAKEEAKPVSNVNAFENILDKFIKENPSISRPKAEFYNPVNAAKTGAEEDDDLVTETLASIYYKQGYYKKAIRAYEKLCLIYPHKMAYFASLIQKIKTENKD